MGYREVKVVLLGSSGVGKTSILYRFVADDYRQEEEATIGAAFMGKMVDYQGTKVKFNIWDTAGQERFHSIAKLYYRDADAAVLVYDITNEQSFQELERWDQQLADFGPHNIYKVVAGNKEDLFQSEVIHPDQALQFAKKIHAGYKKTSAKMNYGVQQIFDMILNHTRCQNSRQGSMKLPEFPRVKQKKCCK